MSNGWFHYFKHLGLCWCLGFVASASIAADQDILDAISDVQNAVIDLDGTVDGFYSSVDSYLYDIQHSTALISSDTSSILDDLQLVASILSSSFSGTHLYTEDSQLHYDLNAYRNEFRAFASQNTNQLETVNDKLADVISAVNNLTNFLCYSPDYQAAIYTNFPALFAYIDSTGSTGYDAYITLWRLLGRQPTEQEARMFDNASSNGLGQWIAFLLNFGYSYYDLPDSLLEYANDVPYYNTGPYPFGSDNESIVESFTKLRYYQYGTRPLLDFFESATNDYPISQAIITDLDSQGRPRPRFSQGFVDSVESLGSSFSDSVSTNIAAVNTNEIVQISDNGYKNQLNKITAEKLSTYVDTDLSDAVENINIQIASFMPEITAQNSLVISFGTISFLSSSKNVEFTLSPLPSIYFAAQKFMFRVLKMIVLLFVVYGIYDFVVKETEL